jgi:hypothetical protein
MMTVIPMVKLVLVVGCYTLALRPNVPILHVLLVVFRQYLLHAYFFLNFLQSLFFLIAFDDFFPLAIQCNFSIMFSSLMLRNTLQTQNINMLPKILKHRPKTQ